MPAFLPEFRRVDPKQPDAGSPDTAGPLAFAIHNQRITVRYACRAGNIGMGGEGEHHHQGGKAAEQGNAGAQSNLGAMYQNGQGVPQDYAKALQWYRKAAEQGKASAQNNLGVMYSKGQGVPQDYVQAHMWYNLAASRPSPGVDLDQSVKHRDIVAKMMTPAQISEAQKLAREWRPKK